jgi:SAM-dependent methyltransferase
MDRDSFYQPGMPASSGNHYRAFVRFAEANAGQTILDLGCGYGAYSVALVADGYRCVGCDRNLDYLRQAVPHGLPVVAADSVLPFADGSFDTVLLFEVIEHVPNPVALVREAFRVARKNVLVTVPNIENLEVLKSNDVTYAHMLSTDHFNFFDPTSLAQLLGEFAKNVKVERGDPIYPFWFLRKSGAYHVLRILYRIGLLKPRFFSRIYAVASVRQN